jgi:hypothetical protein
VDDVVRAVAKESGCGLPRAALGWTLKEAPWSPWTMVSPVSSSKRIEAMSLLVDKPESSDSLAMSLVLFVAERREAPDGMSIERTLRGEDGVFES